MNTSVQARRSAVRLVLSMLLAIGMLPISGLLQVQPAQAQYLTRFNTIANGALTFTGNTLGLGKQPNANAPGVSDAIGAFIATNTGLRDGTYPFGTTGDWHQNSSAALLNMPPSSTVLYAELIWSGSYSYGGENVLAALDTPVSLVTPSGTSFPIAPDPATSLTLGTPSGTGACPSDPDPSPAATTPCFYLRSANVTAQVQAAGAGAYVVGGVPGTQSSTDTSHNNAGWTLAVAYRNPSLPARSLTLFIGEEITNAASSTPVTISGFCTPPSGAVSGRLLLSATEGDANRVGDQMQFGPDNTTLAPITGPNNPINNFFASQINGDTGALDTSGTFGARNQNAAGTANIVGGRQGWDITNVDVSSQLKLNQVSAVAKGTSSGDQYVINALGTQINVSAPAFPPDTKTVDKTRTFVGDTLTYSIRVENIGTADAQNVVFYDSAPAGTSFVPNSFTVNGVAQPGADPATGVNLGVVSPGPANAKFVSFQAKVDRLPPTLQFDNRARWTYDYVSCAGQAPLSGEVITNQVTTKIALLQSSKSVTPTGPVVAGQALTYEIKTSNAGSINTVGTTLQDSIPAGTTYIAGSTTLNGVAVPDVGGMPFATARQINSPGAPAGQIAPGASAVVRFQVRVNPGVTSTITNLAVVDEDGPGGLPPGNVQAFNPVVNLAATKAAALAVDTAPIGGSPGDTIEYTITIANRGTGAATNVSFNDSIPANSSYVPGSTRLNGAVLADKGTTMPFVGGLAINGPGEPAGQLAAGATAVIVFRVVVANPLPGGVTQIVNQGVVSSAELPALLTDDPSTPQAGDPTIVPVSAAPVIDATKVAALQIDADANGVVSPGDTLRYTVTIGNSGNTEATGVRYTDTPDRNTTLVANSVSTSQGAITSGNTGTPPVTVDIGTIAAPSGKVTIGYSVRVNNPLPSGVTELVNQGITTSNEVPAVPTDDPKSPQPGDPTRVPVVAKPVLSAHKVATLLIDADRNGVASPSDTLLYQVTIENTGNAAATGVRYTDTPDANTRLVPGSVQTSAGTITSGNAGVPPVAVDIGIIAGGGASVTISYQVAINNPLPAGVTRIVNQGVANSNETPPVPTDDPKTPQPSDPTMVPIVVTPKLDATKTDRLLVDADGNGAASPGDTLQYIVAIRNSGNSAATAVVFDDTPDANTRLVAGSVKTSVGTVAAGNTAGDTRLSVAIGDIPGGGAQVTISFQVTVNNPLPLGVTRVSNQGIITAGNVPTGLTDDPETPQPGDPTETPLLLEPKIGATKTDTLLIDADGNGGASPGDTLRYTITVQNTGNAAASLTVVDDHLDANVTLVAGTVSTSAGAVTAGNTAGDTVVGVAIGNLPAGASATISFEVRINNPLPAGVSEIRNQAIVSGNFPPVPTDDPKTPQPGDPNRTPLLLQPQLGASKLAVLFTDADNSGAASPGDTLLYQVTIQNSGNAPATNTVFTDIPDTNTKLVVGSVQSSQGTVAQGNSAGDVSVRVTIGDIPARGGSVVVSFRVTINNPLADPNTKEIVNQGLASGDFPSVPTDDPRTPQPGDPTITPLVLEPRLIGDKIASLLIDADKNGAISPGDTLQYIITIKNVGNRSATAVTYTDTPDANTTLVAGSVKISQGTITGGNTGAPPVTVSVGTLPNGATASIGYQVTINKPLPANVVAIANQGIIRSPGTPDVPTNDPRTPQPGDPTKTPIAAVPVLTADKIDFLLIDTNKSGRPGAGDTLLYVIEIANRGNAAATNVKFADTPDSLTVLVAGTVKTSQGVVTQGNISGDTSLAVDIGTIPAGGEVRISFQVRLKDLLTRNIIINQGNVTSDGIPDVPTNDPDTAQPGDPTITSIPPGEATSVALVSFTAARQGNRVAVSWATAAELNTWGFYVYRSADGTRESAVRVTPSLIPAQGRGNGGITAYSWIDNNVQSDTIYTYWLQEVELNGSVNEYGPATARLTPASSFSIFLPVVLR